MSVAIEVNLHRHIISLGAGVQSSTMLIMAAHGEITPKPELAIFADTGWEPKEVYDWLEWLKSVAEPAGIPIVVVSKGNILRDTLERVWGERNRSAILPFFLVDKKGNKGQMRRQCTAEYKIEPVHKGIRGHLGYTSRQRIKEHVHLWMGISTDEIFRVKDSRTPWITNRYPLIEKQMNRNDCVAWFEKRGYPLPPKSSCIGCPFHSDSYWRHLKETNPKEWEEAVEFDKAIRVFPLVKGDVYLHAQRIPLDEVDLRTNAEKGQTELDLFNNECEGMCGL